MTTLQKATQDKLRSYIERIERIDEKRKALAADAAEIFNEAKSIGFDTKIMRKVLALRKKTKSEREEEDAILTTYLHAMGMADTPLGDWAEKNERATNGHADTERDYADAV